MLFSVSPILTGAGLVTAGVAIIRAGACARPSRFLPLTPGVYTILVPIPVMIASSARQRRWRSGPSRAGTCCGSYSAPASCASPPAPFRATRQWQRSPVLPDRTSCEVKTRALVQVSPWRQENVCSAWPADPGRAGQARSSDRQLTAVLDVENWHPASRIDLRWHVGRRGGSRRLNRREHTCGPKPGNERGRVWPGVRSGPVSDGRRVSLRR